VREKEERGRKKGSFSQKVFEELRRCGRGRGIRSTTARLASEFLALHSLPASPTSSRQLTLSELDLRDLFRKVSCRR